MIAKFKQWFREIEDKAIKEKKAIARKKGDESAWKKEIWKSAEKNTSIKKKFKEEGKNIGYESRPYKIDNKVKGGWLYDFCWRKLDKSKNLEKIILAMEIEMTQKDGSIKNDFNKLLQADAKYKIMVFQQNSKDKNEKKAEKKVIDKVNSIFTELQAVANTYKPKSTSNYLLCGWCVPSGKFEFDDFKVKVTRKSAA